MARPAAQLKPTFDTGAESQSEPASGTATVTVYCKIAQGYWLRAFKMVSATEPSPTGLRDIPGGVARELGRFRIAGPARPIGGDYRAPVVAGYAVTHGVPKELWDAWYEHNHRTEIVTNNLLFAHEDQGYGNGQAHALRDTTTGMEPLSRDKDPRAKAVTRSTSMMTGVEPFVRSE